MELYLQRTKPIWHNTAKKLVIIKITSKNHAIYYLLKASTWERLIVNSITKENKY